MRTIAFLSLILVLVVSIAQSASAASTSYSQMITKLRSLSTYQTTVHITIDAKVGHGASDQGMSVGCTEHIVYKKPNLLIVSIPDYIGGITIWSDGSQMYQYYGANNEYKQSAVPKDLIKQFTMTGEGVDLKEAGTGKLSGVPVTIVRGAGIEPGTTLTLWIGTDDHLLRQIVYAMPKTATGTYTTILTEVFKDTILNAPLSTAGFSLKLPKTAMKSSSGAAVPGGIGLGIPGVAK